MHKSNINVLTEYDYFHLSSRETRRTQPESYVDSRDHEYLENSCLGRQQQLISLVNHKPTDILTADLGY